MDFINQLPGQLIYLLIITVLARMILGVVVQFMSMQGGGAPDILVKIYDVIFAVTEPLLAPIRRVLPQTGMIDFSPVVLIIILTVIEWILEALI